MPEILIAPAAESEGEGGAGEGGRQSFPQKFSLRLQNATQSVI